MARRLGVTRDDVVTAAVRVCDRAGVEGLTVAAVAAEVGCRPPSVYHHVDGLDGLVRAVTFVAAEQLLAILEEARAGATGVARLDQMVTAAHRWGLRHPARYDALRRPVRDDPELSAARAQVLLPVQDALVALGVPAERRATLVAALVAAVRGFIGADLDADRGLHDTGDAPHTGDAPDDADGTADTGHVSDQARTGERDEGHELLVRLLLDHVEALGGAESGDPAIAARSDDASGAST